MASTISKTLKTSSTSQIATVAAGCFWGVEHIYLKNFKDRLLDTKVGYSNGSAESPSYKAVCTGNTNHAEALQISFEPTKITYKELIEFFFLMHDPTTLNSQGPDIGTQYRSIILTHDDNQVKIANEVLKEMQVKWYPNDKIVTVIEPIKNFYDAEEYHQLYLFENPSGYQCPSHFIRTTPK
ncbi:hypothetical protein CANARDRAFT_202061 [[Candida] arabinofermentans NRRL YB-2248]|uniref:peptide-methionine (S)-S-oxide reductase n=1 Tax=[Candida] arabinofermentans NRRL YB-2248 TaxID=983967 RepID=A0A1E4SWN0_9ASCO|nr:hypothetical protein CANARDRAFT_202061 [[Candida] arabinofermentans NRRL YB-2248]